MNEEEQSWVKQHINVMVRSGYYGIEDVEEMIIDECKYGYPGTPDDVKDQMIAFGRSEMAAFLETAKTWEEKTTNDRIRDAFAELTREHGVIALENAGYTMSDGWTDIAEAKHYNKSAWAGAFFHMQDVERGIEGDGLMLAYGAFVDDDTHEPESLRAAKLICDVLEKHEVATSWNGSIDSRISIDPFEWKNVIR